MKTDQFFAGLVALAIGLVGYAYIENQGQYQEAQRIQELRAQNEQLRRENTEIMGRLVELQAEHRAFKDGVIYGK